LQSEFAYGGAELRTVSIGCIRQDHAHRDILFNRLPHLLRLRIPGSNELNEGQRISFSFQPRPVQIDSQDFDLISHHAVFGVRDLITDVKQAPDGRRVPALQALVLIGDARMLDAIHQDIRTAWSVGLVTEASQLREMIPIPGDGLASLFPCCLCRRNPRLDHFL
jgi:hypothetical protein